MQQKLVAIDAHKRTCTAVVFQDHEPAGKPVRLLSTRPALERLANDHPEAHFALEACSVSEWMIDTLRDAGVTAAAYTPPKRRGKAGKSDPKDAARLGRKVLLGDVNEVHVPTPEHRALRDRIRQRHYLVQQRVRFINRIKHTVNRRNLELPKTETGRRPRNVLRQDVRQRLLEKAPDLAEEYAIADALTTRLKALDKEVPKLGEDIHEVQLLRTIPGFGPVIALAFHVETGPITRFRKAGNLVSYYGLDPTGVQSGDSYVDHHRISRKGRNYLRTLLVQAAWVHVQSCPDSDLTAKYRRLAGERGKVKGKAIVAVAAHLVRVAWTLLREDRPFKLNPPARASTCRDPPTGRRV